MSKFKVGETVYYFNIWHLPEYEIESGCILKINREWCGEPLGYGGPLWYVKNSASACGINIASECLYKTYAEAEQAARACVLNEIAKSCTKIDNDLYDLFTRKTRLLQSAASLRVRLAETNDGVWV